MTLPGVTGEKSQLTSTNVPVWDEEAEDHKCVCMCCRCCHIRTAGLVIAILSIVLSAICLLSFLVGIITSGGFSAMKIINEAVLPLAFIVSASLTIVGIQKVRPAFIIPLMVGYVMAIVMGVVSTLLILTGVFPLWKKPMSYDESYYIEAITTYVYVAIVVIVALVTFLQCWCVHVLHKVREYLMSKEKLQQP